jgi:hypothetical protein
VREVSGSNPLTPTIRAVISYWLLAAGKKTAKNKKNYL